MASTIAMPAAAAIPLEWPDGKPPSRSCMWA